MESSLQCMGRDDTPGAGDHTTRTARVFTTDNGRTDGVNVCQTDCAKAEGVCTPTVSAIKRQGFVRHLALYRITLACCLRTA
jgi:hypothetical protein